jgi:cell division protein FtsA
MFLSRKPSLIVGLDIGTSSVNIAVGERRSDGGLSLLGGHSVEARGMRKGEVINHSEASASILQAIQTTEEMMNMDIREVELALTGGHIESENYRGTVMIQSDTHEISEEDVDEAVDHARSCVLLADGKMILHVVRQQYYVDGKELLTMPVGMLGSKLEADAHFIYGIGTRFQNTLNCLQAQQETAVEVKNWVFSGLASALAVLNRHDKELGSIVLDIGAGTTEYVVYSKGMIRQTGAIAVGGDHIVNDILLGLKIQSRRRAESLIHQYGSAVLDDSNWGKTVTMKTSDLISEREITLYIQQIHWIIRCRVEELLGIIFERVRAQGLHDIIGGGVFLTGGVAKLPGIVELAQNIFDLPATLGMPTGFDGQMERLSVPEMSTAVGLVKYAHMKYGDPNATGTGLRSYVKRLLTLGR